MESYMEKWIQFAIDNGWICEYHNGDTMTIEEVLEDKDFLEELITARMHIGIITSKEFIEAVTRGYYGERNYDMDRLPEFIDTITKQQAIHIREGTLDLFITNLLEEGKAEK